MIGYKLLVFIGILPIVVKKLNVNLLTLICLCSLFDGENRLFGSRVELLAHSLRLVSLPFLEK